MKDRVEQFIVEKEEANNRIDAYIAKRADISRVNAQRLISEGKILVNGRNVKHSYKTQENDEITMEQEEPKEVELKAENIPLEIIYEDKDIIVVNDKAHINLSEQIKNHKVEKTYIALVKGNVKENQATINMPIGRSDKDRKKMAVTKNGKTAITHFKVLKRYDKYTLLEVKIETGRTHQIRVHLSQIGYPIVGDSVYSNGKNEWGIEGQCLHAKSLKFKHPMTGKEMYLEAPLPKYFQKILHELESREIPEK